MRKLKSNIVFKYLVVCFSIAYLLGAFANMLLIPRYTIANQDVAAISQHVVKSANFHKNNFLQIFDKSTIDNNQVNSSGHILKSCLPVSIRLGLFTPKPAPVLPQSIILYKHRYAYLSFCSFRI